MLCLATSARVMILDIPPLINKSKYLSGEEEGWLGVKQAGCGALRGGVERVILEGVLCVCVLGTSYGARLNRMDLDGM